MHQKNWKIAVKPRLLHTNLPYIFTEEDVYFESLETNKITIVSILYEISYKAMSYAKSLGKTLNQCKITAEKGRVNSEHYSPTAHCI